METPPAAVCVCACVCHTLAGLPVLVQLVATAAGAERSAGGVAADVGAAAVVPLATVDDLHLNTCRGRSQGKAEPDRERCAGKQRCQQPQEPQELDPQSRLNSHQLICIIVHVHVSRCVSMAVFHKIKAKICRSFHGMV